MLWQKVLALGARQRITTVMAQIETLASKLVPVLKNVVYTSERASILTLLPRVDLRDGGSDSDLFRNAGDLTSDPGRVQRLNICIRSTSATFRWNEGRHTCFALITASDFDEALAGDWVQIITIGAGSGSIS